MSFLSLGNGDRKILGTGGCLTLAALAIGWVGLVFWLPQTVGWPERYGWQCQGRCYLQELWYSPRLLGPNLLADTLFVVLWTAPALWLAGSLYIALRTRRTTR